MAGILLVLAHPDDESFMGGGALAYYARRGVSTALLSFTDGQAGRTGLSGQPALAPREELGALRRAELRRAAERLGVGELITPGWPDKDLAAIPDAQGTALVAEHLRRLRPEILISFGPEGAPNNHPDHVASARWAQAAFELAADPAHLDGLPPHAARKYYWITWPPEVDALRGTAGSPITTILEVGEAVARLKREAFAEHASQHDHLEIFSRLQDILAGREYFHLARARQVPPPQALEHDLFAGLGNSAS